MKHLHTLTCIVDVARSGSIRRTAERLHLTPSALTRKIQDFEQELGAALFDRTTRGMRLTPAGDLLVQHARCQIADMERVRMQIAGLAGLRRGHVALVCSQAFIDRVMPDQVEAYRAAFPGVSFFVRVQDHAEAAAALLDYDADLALVLQPLPLPELQILFASDQPVCAIMGAGHPLAGTGPVRLRDCLQFAVAVPDRSLAVRQALDGAVARAGLSMTIALESGSIRFLRNYVRREDVLSFQILMGIPQEHAGLVVREIDRRDLAPMQAVLLQLRGRTLSDAAAEFVNRIAHSFNQQPLPPPT